MKFHLPKKLMVAVLAAISASTVQAATLYPNEVLNIEEGTTVTWEDYSKMQNGDARSPLVKDGLASHIKESEREHRVNVGASYTF